MSNSFILVRVPDSLEISDFEKPVLNLIIEEATIEIGGSIENPVDKSIVETELERLLKRLRKNDIVRKEDGNCVCYLMKLLEPYMVKTINATGWDTDYLIKIN